MATIQYYQEQISDVEKKIRDTAENIEYKTVDPETNETITLNDTVFDIGLLQLNDVMTTDISFYRLLLDLYATVNNITVESCGCSFGSGFVDEYTPFNPNEARETRIRLISNLIKIVNGNDFPDRFLQKICDAIQVEPVGDWDEDSKITGRLNKIIVAEYKRQTHKK